ncbi:hypothetical protein Pmani_036139 [Petrolisthes manimaculis]|nr:hypothetical protein Pmani_036139 [Petrolisthes manimaculis]
MMDEMDDDDYMNDNDTNTDDDYLEETNYHDYDHDNDNSTTTTDEDEDYEDYDDDDEKTDGEASETQRFFAPPRPPPTTPQTKIAFTVRKVRGRRTAPATLRFQSVLTNAGRGWRGNTFTAPRAGIYYFAFHAVGGRTSDFT